MSSGEEHLSIKVPILDDNGNPQLANNGKLLTEENDAFLAAQDKTINPNITSVENEIKGTKTTFTFLAGILSVITVFLATILII